ncbi:hypothetical protein SAMN04515692_101314 [Leifsonia sp. CL147]|nr:hypothetical protein SAMN04515694_101165 [Leifsonia sp. CL154]SFL21603.1 hypothetical protein SAMN04515692_101314 [Leifsonia sp. CL147]
MKVLIVGAGFEVADRMGIGERVQAPGYRMREVREVDDQGSDPWPRARGRGESNESRSNLLQHCHSKENRHRISFERKGRLSRLRRLRSARRRWSAGR